MRDTKRIEKLTLERYLTASKQSYNIKQHETPDFILEKNGKIIGCEITEYYPDYSKKGSNTRKRESYLKKLHEKIETKLIEKFPKEYLFTINYKATSNIKSKINLEVEVEKIHKLISENIDLRYLNNPSPNINSVIIDKQVNLSTKIIFMLFSDFKPFKKEYIDPIIKEKTKLLKRWNQKFNQKWLIISIGLSMSSDLNIDDFEKSDNIKLDEWDKIILLDIHFSKYVEINAI